MSGNCTSQRMRDRSFIIEVTGNSRTGFTVSPFARGVNVVLRIIILVIVLGLVWWLIGFLPLGEPFTTIIRVLIILALIWEVLALAGFTKSFLNNPPPP